MTSRQYSRELEKFYKSFFRELKEKGFVDKKEKLLQKNGKVSKHFRSKLSAVREELEKNRLRATIKRVAGEIARPRKGETKKAFRERQKEAENKFQKRVKETRKKYGLNTLIKSPFISVPVANKHMEARITSEGALDIILPSGPKGQTPESRSGFEGKISPIADLYKGLDIAGLEDQKLAKIIADRIFKDAKKNGVGAKNIQLLWSGGVGSESFLSKSGLELHLTEMFGKYQDDTKKNAAQKYLIGSMAVFSYNK